MTAHLQPEIWAHVVSFLKRPAPKAFERGDWNDFHQQDLTTVSRVSSTFHEITIPHLYSKSIIVNHLPYLLRHTNDAPISLRKKITPKVQRLKLVRNLRLCALGPPSKLKWHVFDLLDRGDFSAVSESKAERLDRWIKQGSEEAHDLLDFFRTTPIGRIPQLQLESLTLGQARQVVWKEICKRPEVVAAMGKTIPDIAERFLDYFSRLGIRHICVYPPLGPYTLPYFQRGAKKPKLTLNVHHPDNEIYPILCLGGHVRHFFERGHNSYGIVNAAPNGPGVLPGGAHLDSLLMSVDFAPSSVDTKLLIRQSDVEIFGLFSKPAFVPLNVQFGERVDGEHEDDRNERAFGQYMVEPWSEHLPEIWQQRIKFRIWRETPCCEACGWDPKRDRFV